jgi:hypothetical protein
VNNLHRLIKIVGYTAATLGFAYIVKHVKNRKEDLRGWHKIRVEDEKPSGETVSSETKVETEKRTGTRYGSNPIQY